jgi:hypothetical protein
MLMNSTITLMATDMIAVRLISVHAPILRTNLIESGTIPANFDIRVSTGVVIGGSHTFELVESGYT